MINGPGWIPHVYNGRNKTFWMFGLENYLNRRPWPTLTSVPSLAERQGDFSGAGVTIYNPFATRSIRTSMPAPEQRDAIRSTSARSFPTT